MRLCDSFRRMGREKENGKRKEKHNGLKNEEKVLADLGVEI